MEGEVRRRLAFEGTAAVVGGIAGGETVREVLNNSLHQSAEGTALGAQSEHAIGQPEYSLDVYGGALVGALVTAAVVNRIRHMRYNHKDKRHVAEEQAITTQHLHEVGWDASGNFGYKKINATFDRTPNVYGAGPEQITKRLKLRDEKGEMLPGFTLIEDKESGNCVVEYKGNRTDRYEKFVDDMIDWGVELDTRQHEALNSEDYAAPAQALAVEIVTEVLEKITIKRIDNASAAVGLTRLEGVDASVGENLRTLLKDYDPDESVKLLECLFAQLIKRHNKAGPAMLPGGSLNRAEADVLVGASSAVRHELIRLRETQVLNSET